MQLTIGRVGVAITVALLAGAGWSSEALADDHIRGVIAGRGAGGALILFTDDGSTVTVVMSDATKVRREINMRQLKTSSSVLLPGLRVEVSGQLTSPDRIVAERVRFGGSDLKIARAIRGGVGPVEQRTFENERRIADNAKLIDEQQKTLREQEAQIASNREQIAANDQKFVATTGAVDTRIGALNDYRVVSTVTVHFANGKASISSDARNELQQLAAEARELTGYMVQIEGYASAVGTSSVNQRLSAQRADAVAAVLNQSGIPPTRMLVPASMGTSDQIAPNTTAKGQAENRRTVVTLLQNKGITQK
jgi:OmpA-OmpF porin, OOP family